MKAQNLTISIPTRGCNKKCPYCISEITGHCESNFSLMTKNIDKVVNVAKATQISSIMLTSKSEILLDPITLNDGETHVHQTNCLINQFKKFPLEIQTNGKYLNMLNKLNDSSYDLEQIDVFSFSIDSISQLEKLKYVCEYLKEADKTLRACINVTDMINPLLTFEDIFKIVKDTGFDQMTLRRIVSPDFAKEKICLSKEGKKVVEWIDGHATGIQYNKLKNQLRNLLENLNPERTMPYGLKIYDLEGLAVTYSDYCIQESNYDDDIRSLVFLEDGHIYTSWKANMATRLF